MGDSLDVTKTEKGGTRSKFDADVMHKEQGVIKIISHIML